MSKIYYIYITYITYIYVQNILNIYLLHDAKTFIFALNIPLCIVYVSRNKYKTRDLLRPGKQESMGNINTHNYA